MREHRFYTNLALEDFCSNEIIINRTFIRRKKKREKARTPDHLENKIDTALY